jgi:hypothetical protein
MTWYELMSRQTAKRVKNDVVSQEGRPEAGMKSRAGSLQPKYPLPSVSTVWMGKVATSHLQKFPAKPLLARRWAEPGPTPSEIKIFVA